MRPNILFPLFADISSLKGIGAKLHDRLTKLCGNKVLDLLWHRPRSGIVRKLYPNIASALHNDIVILRVTIVKHSVPHRGTKSPYRVICQDDTGALSLVFFRAGREYMEKNYPVGTTKYVSGRLEVFNNTKQISHPDYCTATVDTIPKFEVVYAMASGVTPKVLRNIITQAIQKIDDLPEWINTEIIKNRTFPSFKESILEIHNPKNDADIIDSPAIQRLAYDELLSNQITIAISRTIQKSTTGTPIVGTGHYKKLLLHSLPFALTHAQTKAIAEIEQDMNSTTPMTRLLQGDVGAGKTIVALCAILSSVENNKQSILIAPTEILAQQHFTTISRLLENITDISVVLLTGRNKGKERIAILENIKNGTHKIIIGTHALFQDDVLYGDLALIVIDEQHRFGVEQRLSLNKKGNKPHVLSMTATPIPRTLVMTAFGDMDTSKLDEKPSSRLPVRTHVMPDSKIDTIAQSLHKAIGDNRQVYWVCPLVEESDVLNLTPVEERYNYLCAMFGTDTVCYIHGKMKQDEKEQAMNRFITGNAKILVATTVIEVGVDVPNASIMIIEQAERFGLSQLHQLRGRVGRGTVQSDCLLIYKNLTQNAHVRLNTMRKTDDGFKIAETDLELRGPGDILGTKQSGIPEFKIANLQLHKDLLEMAQKDARYIIETDSHLQSERGQHIRILLHLFERDKSINILLKSG